MAENKTISIWLKLKDGENAGKFILQKRLEKEKSFPFFCQATWSGGVEIGESVDDAIKRECKEELGENFYNNFDFAQLKFFEKQDFFRESKGNIWECNHYIGEVSEKKLKLVKMHELAFPEFVFVDEKDEIFSINSMENPKENIVLFDDQYKTFLKIIKTINGY